MTKVKSASIDVTKGVGGVTPHTTFFFFFNIKSVLTITPKIMLLFRNILSMLRDRTGPKLGPVIHPNLGLVLHVSLSRVLALPRTSPKSVSVRTTFVKSTPVTV